ncbi:hypothetical protein [Neorhizobium sp. DT-125]|uniref:hypothetical protein n=1 Tax=Neorhizobium sp. DT-125 TaxID=3396163 RepID=UPI003F1B4CA3
MMGCRRMIEASRLRRTVLFAVAHGARKRSPLIRVTPLSRLPHRRREVSATTAEDRVNGRLRSANGHGAWGAVVYLFLTSHCAPATPASRIARPDDLEIDFDTYEYRVNGGEWHYALSADCDGVEISYPSLVALTDDDLGSLAPIVRALRSEAGVGISIARDLWLRCWEGRLRPSLASSVGLIAYRHRASARS